MLVFLPEGFLVLFFRIPLFSLGGHFFVHMDARIDYIFIRSRLIVHSGSILYACKPVPKKSQSFRANHTTNSTKSTRLQGSIVQFKKVMTHQLIDINRDQTKEKSHKKKIITPSNHFSIRFLSPLRLI